ncbi:hypothetical protein GCM10009565_53160 [Amycolatopsis albidoflavus]
MGDDGAEDGALEAGDDGAVSLKTGEAGGDRSLLPEVLAESRRSGGGSPGGCSPGPATPSAGRAADCPGGALGRFARSRCTPIAFSACACSCGRSTFSS